MAKILAHDVHVVRLLKSGWDTQILKAGSEVPKGLQKYVTNPKAFLAEGTEPKPDKAEAGDPTEDLVAELKKRELPTDGTVEEMRERIAEFDAEQGAPAENVEQGAPDESEQNGE